jgi:hypothetical protein
MKSSLKTLGQRIAAAIAARSWDISGQRSRHRFFTGDYIRVRRIARFRMPGQLGQVVSVSPNDPLGAYLVEFDGGQRIRYRSVELERVTYSSSIPASPIQCHH